MRKVILISLALCISSCTTKPFIAKTTYAPQKTITIGFEEGSFNEREYKIDAKKKADEFCGKPAVFIGDEIRSEGPSAAFGVLSKDKNKYVTFSCE